MMTQTIPKVAPALLPVRARFVDLLLPRVMELERLRCRVNAGQEVVPAILAIGGLAHKIAGVAGTLGFARVGHLALQVDARISEARKMQEPVALFWDATEPVLEALMDAMEAHLDE
jgi:hypothetical protein